MTQTYYIAVDAYLWVVQFSALPISAVPLCTFLFAQFQVAHFLKLFFLDFKPLKTSYPQNPPTIKDLHY